MQVTIGGNRVGSGEKMKASLHNYYRSTHNLSEKFASTAACGVLYPCMVKLGMRGDTFDININADARTIPTEGPLFGKFKMQVDVYQAPVRLYQGILHNNPLAIGLNMAQVKFPLVNVIAEYDNTSEDQEWHGNYCGEFSKSCLMKYLGMSGIGVPSGNNTTGSITRKINALPMLAYYDIYKTYYANKQEEKGYVLSGGVETQFDKLIHGIRPAQPAIGEAEWMDQPRYRFWIDPTYDLQLQIAFNIKSTQEEREQGHNTITFYANGQSLSDNLSNLHQDYGIEWNSYEDENEELGKFIRYQILINTTQLAGIRGYIDSEYTGPMQIAFSQSNINVVKEKSLIIKDFNLSNIDDMRYDLLSFHTLGSSYTIGSGDAGNIEPYYTNYDTDDDGKLLNKYPMNGLVLKTYQNDIFNNWLNTDWIEGENGISEMSKVSVDANGDFSMDSLNFAQKLYNMLNRIAVAGNTYEDWQDVVYEEVKRRQIESPIYCGGISKDIVFDEIVQSAPTKDQPLGTLGGRGRAKTEQKGGRIHIKCDEACFIIAIVSLTPRIFYSQGNEFYMTDVFSMDDLHKPAMDGIGFQDLIGERMAWWNTIITHNSSSIDHRSKIGKLPAWIEYMTSVDKVYGDFAEEYGRGYMILNRNYERGTQKGSIKDATTYVDPQKYNYIFAYAERDAQNFWLWIDFNIKARRLMSARLIPNV